MCRFIESIKLNDGIIYRLAYHQQRTNNTFYACFEHKNPLDLALILSNEDLPTHGLYKIRIVYDTEIVSISVTPYVKREINSLKIVASHIDSKGFKNLDRSQYETAFSQRGDCDDILFVQNGLLTDTSYANIALYNGKEWITPKKPIIYGSHRAKLLSEKVIIERNIPISSLANYHKMCIFNALIEFEELIIDISNIRT